MPILDTDILTAILCGKKDAVEKVNELVEKSEEIATTSMNALELLKVAAGSGGSEKKISQINDVLKSLKIYNFDYDSAMHTAKIYAHLNNSKKAISNINAMIAGISITKNTSIITRNTKDYDSIKNLKLETW